MQSLSHNPRSAGYANRAKILQAQALVMVSLNSAFNEPKNSARSLSPFCLSLIYKPNFDFQEGGGKKGGGGTGGLSSAELLLAKEWPSGKLSKETLCPILHPDFI